MQRSVGQVPLVVKLEHGASPGGGSSGGTSVPQGGIELTADGQ